MPALNSYLHFNGNTEEAFAFYKSVFGGEYVTVMRYGDVPDEHKMGESQLDKIMHISLPVGPETILMGSDTPEMYGKSVTGTNFSISVNTGSTEEADKLFSALSAGGQATMPMEKVFWGDYFGMLTDKFGIQWMVGYDEKYKK